MRTHLPVFCLLVVLAGQAASAAESPASEFRALVTELRELRKVMAAMRDDLAEIKTLLKEQAAEGKEARPPAPGVTFEHRERGPDIEALKAIHLPEKPTEAQVREYIDKIVEASRGQNSSSYIDPQVVMLMKVGPEHLELLMEKMNDPSAAFFPAERHLETVVTNLAGEDHKALILENLEYHPDLAKVVLRYGWEKDAREILLEGLRTKWSFRLPVAWIRCVAKLKDPTVYPALRKYFVHGSNRELTYGTLRVLEGFPIKEAVAEAWKEAKLDDSWELQNMACIAAGYGHVDALLRLFDLLETEGMSSFGGVKIRSTLIRYLPKRGSMVELAKWVRANKDVLSFDMDRRLYVIRAKAPDTPPKGKEF